MAFAQNYDNGVANFYDPLGVGKSLFEKKKSVQPRPDYPYLSAQNLYKWSTDYQQRYPYDPAKPYEGQLSAPSTTAENTAQTQLTQFQGMGTPSTLSAANKYNTDVLQGSYDPRQSPYYTAMKEQILRDAQEAGAAVRHNAASSGMLHSDPRHIQERKLTENVSSQLAQLLGGIYENERGRMGQAAALSPQLAQSQYDLPIKQIAAGTTYGAIPRETEQANLDRLLQEYLRQVQGAGVPLQVLGGLSGKSYGDYNAQPYTPGQQTGSDMAQTLVKLLPLILAA